MSTPDCWDYVCAGLADAARVFGGGDLTVPLVYAPIVGEVDGGGNPQLALAIELVYEGYLLHYRTSRLVPPATPAQRRLLAGDYYYAHGLSLIAADPDVARIGLLTKLMASCAYVRAEELAFAVDDALWELTVLGVAAQCGSPLRRVSTAACESFETAIRAGRPSELPALSARLLSGVRSEMPAQPATVSSVFNPVPKPPEQPQQLEKAAQ